MIILTVIVCSVLAGCYAAPNRQGTDMVITYEYFYNTTTVIHTSQHEIVKIIAPFNQYNIEGDLRQRKINPIALFFVEADIGRTKRADRGLYVLKNGTATELLYNGRDAVATNENVVYFGASDGIYKYNETANKAEKHGTVTDNIMQLAHSNKTNAVYYLTIENELYKLSEDAETSVKVPLEDVRYLVFDKLDNMYYYNSNKTLYVVDSEIKGVPKEFKGVPSQAHFISLFPTTFTAADDEVLLIVGDTQYSYYVLNSSGKYSKLPIVMDVQVSAIELQLAFVQFYSLNKKIYKYV